MEEELIKLVEENPLLLELCRSYFSLKIQVRKAENEGSDITKDLRKSLKKQKKKIDDYNLPQIKKDRINLYAQKYETDLYETAIINAEIIYGECMDCVHLKSPRMGSIDKICEEFQPSTGESKYCNNHKKIDYSKLPPEDAVEIHKFRAERKRELNLAKIIFAETKVEMKKKYS